MTAPRPAMSWLWRWAQPLVSVSQVRSARSVLIAYRTMAFVTGTILIAGVVGLILQDTSAPGVRSWVGYLWIAHGWLFLVYVVITAMLGGRMRWPVPRYALIMLAGTIPTMSFLAEHIVTKAIRRATRPDPRGVPRVSSASGPEVVS